MKESSNNTKARREAEGFFDKFCRGAGIDVGCGADPVTQQCRGWDVQDGDAQKMAGVATNRSISSIPVTALSICGIHWKRCSTGGGS